MEINASLEDEPPLSLTIKTLQRLIVKPRPRCSTAQHTMWINHATVSGWRLPTGPAAPVLLLTEVTPGAEQSRRNDLLSATSAPCYRQRPRWHALPRQASTRLRKAC